MARVSATEKYPERISFWTKNLRALGNMGSGDDFRAAILASCDRIEGKETKGLSTVAECAYKFLAEDIDTQRTKYRDTCEQNKLNRNRGTVGDDSLRSVPNPNTNPNTNTKNNSKPNPISLPDRETIEKYCDEIKREVDISSFIAWAERQGQLTDWRAAIRSWNNPKTSGQAYEQREYSDDALNAVGDDLIAEARARRETA